MSSVAFQSIQEPPVRSTAATLILAVGIALACVSMVTAAPATLTTAQIVEKNTAARGGLEAWRGVQALSIKGSLDLGTPRATSPKEIEVAQRGPANIRKSLADAGLRREAAVAATGAQGQPDAAAAKPVMLPFELEMKRPHKTRLELVFNQQKSVQTFDGTTGWKYRPYLAVKAPVALNPTELQQASAQADLDGMLIDSAAKGNKVAYEKMEKLDQYVLRVTLKNGETRRLWVDAQTFLETRVDNKPARVEGRMRSASTYYRDYRAVNKLMIPYVVETRVDGISNGGKMLVDAVQVNPTLDDSRFAKPM
jgi:outer membrane lipoprotein-sorting protein